MSYANAAAQGAPNESPKIPAPAQVETTSDPHGSVEVVENNLKQKATGGKVIIEEKIRDVKKDLPKLGDDLLKAEKDAEKRIREEYNEQKGPVINFFKKVGSAISDAATYVYNSTYSASVTAQEELQNPVVASQTVLTIGTIAGLIVGIQERSRIFGGKTDAEITAILTGLVGLVALDGYIFTQLYPKYDKKYTKTIKKTLKK